MGLEKQFDMATNAKDKFPALTLMQCDEPEEEGMYLCLIKNHLGMFWEKAEWVEDSIGRGWYNLSRSEVIAWQPLPLIPTEQELEHLYKIPISNDE